MKVKIKTWEELEKKYGASEDGNISKHGHPYCFDKEMIDMCGKEVELENANGGYGSVLGKYDGYYIEKWMVKKNGKQRQSYKS